MAHAPPTNLLKLKPNNINHAQRGAISNPQGNNTGKYVSK